MEKNELMKHITDSVGREKAIELVVSAYNTELVTTWLSRLQPGKPLGGPARHDHLQDALERVNQVVDLAK
ncbi:MAG: hypothetical protein RL324_2148 [Verrucomicrobiota bacterium]|jgi:hypothetical protein